MTVKEIIEKLSEFSEDMEVCYNTQWHCWRPINRIERGVGPMYDIEAGKSRMREFVGVAYIEDGRVFPAEDNAED